MSKADLIAWIKQLGTQRWLFVGVVSACLFVENFARFARLPKAAYAYRDDALITLSHARNSIDYGSIGVDAAGVRVEGFSTALRRFRRR